MDRTAIAPRVNAADKRQALSVIAEIAARTLKLKPAAVLEGLLKREEAGSTGVGHGVATPHTHVAGLNRMRGIFVRLESPIDFGAVDDQPVDLLFALLAPPDAATQHLRNLAKVSRTLRQPELREQLRQAKSADAILALLVTDPRQTAA
ncbi:MAG TPA: PTS sugar transporter subunit IIA [Caulobacteraceae bacterium]|nr:PTS sugar transporter subunit IIA [Caulobacteraceae bacterium]